MTRNTCPTCRAPITSTVDNDVAGLPITLHPHPTTRQYALAHIINGGQAVIAENDRTRGQHRTRYYALTAGRINNPNLAHYPHYVTHQCDATPPPPPATTHTTTTEVQF